MISLSDTQRVLLSTASQRESGSLHPLPACLKPGGGIARAMTMLLDRGFAEERETSDAGAVRRTDGDLRYGVYVTTAGKAAIGVAEPESDAPHAQVLAVEAAAPPIAKVSKTSLVLDLLHRPGGATLPELIEATGWLPHTTRAALTGLRKRGHAIERSNRDNATCYRIVVAG